MPGHATTKVVNTNFSAMIMKEIVEMLYLAHLKTSHVYLIMEARLGTQVAKFPTMDYLVSLNFHFMMVNYVKMKYS